MLRPVALLGAVLALSACTLKPPQPGTMSYDDADNRCINVAYQQAEWGWGALGGIGAAIGLSRAKNTPEYAACMAYAGYPLGTGSVTDISHD